MSWKKSLKNLKVRWANGGSKYLPELSGEAVKFKMVSKDRESTQYTKRLGPTHLSFLLPKMKKKKIAWVFTSMPYIGVFFHLSWGQTQKTIYDVTCMVKLCNWEMTQAIVIVLDGLFV